MSPARTKRCKASGNAKQTKQTKDKQMKKTMTQYDIADALMNDIHANWSRAGAFALAEYFEQLEEDLGESIEFDAVAIRCDFSQYESLQEWANDYFTQVDAIHNLGFTLNEDGIIEQSEDEVNEAIREYIQDNGQLIEFNGGVIVSSF